jgi:hypothetical protein
MDPNRKMAFRLSEEKLRWLLELPEGTEIKSLEATIDPPSIWVVATNDDWPEQPQDCEAPLARTQQELIDGRLHVTYTDIAGEPAYAGLHTEYRWQADPLRETRADVPRMKTTRDKQAVLDLQDESGGTVYCRLAGEWDLLGEDGDW